MRFRHDTDEESCPRSILDEKFGPLACLRRRGHCGKCIALMCDAAAADGVCFDCRMPLDGPPRTDCERRDAHV
jgi:hypothetical protein